ncbi:MAG: polysaccharide deacetylase family protein [Planctomycetota bacterium]
MPKPTASLSLDLDNKWAYLRTHGDPGWEAYRCYLAEVAPRVTRLLERHAARLTVFVVGRDLDLSGGAEAVDRFVDAGYEIGNHSQNHYPWLASLDPEELEREVAASESAITTHTGSRPVGFRAPGFSWSPELLGVLARRGYAYDASTFPTVIGPLARLYSRFRLPTRAANASSPAQTFATLADAFRPLSPYTIETPSGPLAEAPVTTMPLFRVPIHVTYLTFLAQTSTAAAKAYLRTALMLCRVRGVAPSMLLHPLDFLGAEDEPSLGFFPGMKLRRDAKLRLVDWLLASLAKHWRLATVSQHAGELTRMEPTAPPPADAKADATAETHASPPEAFAS